MNFLVDSLPDGALPLYSHPTNSENIPLVFDKGRLINPKSTGGRKLKPSRMAWNSGHKFSCYLVPLHEITLKSLSGIVKALEKNKGKKGMQAVLCISKKSNVTEIGLTINEKCNRSKKWTKN